MRQLIVYVDYRMKAGNKTPSWKALRARVKQGSMLGSDLTRQGITDPEQIVIEATAAIIAMNIIGLETITFEFDDLLHDRGFADKRLRILDNGRAVPDFISL